MATIWTISGALAYDTDTIEDSFILAPGAEVKGAFIIYDYNSGIRAETDFEWISFDKDLQSSIITNIIGQSVSEEAVSVPYYISIPKEADIGIYRTVIKLSSGSDVKYLNVKISVQNKPYVTISNIYNQPYAVYFIFIVISLILISILVFLYMRFKNG